MTLIANGDCVSVCYVGQLWLGAVVASKWHWMARAALLRSSAPGIQRVIQADLPICSKQGGFLPAAVGAALVGSANQPFNELRCPAALSPVAMWLLVQVLHCTPPPSWQRCTRICSHTRMATPIQQQQPLPLVCQVVRLLLLQLLVVLLCPVLLLLPPLSVLLLPVRL